MPDLRQSLRDFVATSNSGKYSDEATLMSKFPELKGYDIQALRDFVATSNSGKYATEDEVFSKFPEFNTSAQPPVKKKDSSESAIPQQQKASTMESSSGDGSLATPPTKQKLPTDMSGKPIISKANDALLKNAFEQSKEKKAYQKIVDLKDKEQKNIYGQEFDKKGPKKVDKSTSKYLNDKLSTIDPKLINNNEEYVVPQMNYQFGDLGFKFEESGATGDWMIATAPNGKKMEISLDPFADATAVSESLKLKQFIKDNTPDKGLYVLDKTYTEESKKITSQKQVDSSIKKISDEANGLNNSLKTFMSRKKEFDSIPKGTPEYIQMQKDLIAERDNLIKQQENLKLKQTSLERSVGKYTAMKGEQGTWLGGTWNAFLAGSSSITAGVTDLMIDIGAEIMPNEMMMSPKDLKDNSIGISKKLGIKPPSENQTYAQWKSSLTEDQQDDVEDEMDDVIKKSQKKDVIPAVRKGNREVLGSSTTTPEWENLKSQDFWGGAYLGVVKSLPAVIGGSGPAGWAQRTAQFYGQISDGIREEMDKNPEFEKVSENEKLAVVLPVGITGAVLEEVGLKNIKGSSGLINRVMMSALGKAGVGTTAKGFRELVENEVDSRLAKGLLTLGAAGLAEAETGAGQQAAEFAVKDIYNAIKGKQMFDTPDSVGEWVTDVAKAGAQEAVGGFILGVPTAVSAAYSEKGFFKMDDYSFRVFEAAANDENIQKAFITNLKTQITQGSITTADAKEQLNNYRNSVGLFKSLPEGLSIQQKKEAMNLLKEKRDLQNQVDGKDPSLVAKLKERIDAIDTSLVGISEAANNEKVTAENNRKEFDALPEEEKTKLKDEAGKKLLDIISDRNEEDIVLDDETLTEFAFKDFVRQKQSTNRIAEIEASLSPDAETQVTGRERKKLEKELVKLKETQETVVEEIPEEITNLNDDEVKFFTVENLDEVPEQFRDRAKKREGMEVKSRKTILGIPIGPETSQIIGEGYTYSLTGKEIKDYAIQKQTADESVLRAGQPELGLPKVGEGNAKPEGLTEEKTITTPEQKGEVIDRLKTVEDTAQALKDYGESFKADGFYEVVSPIAGGVFNGHTAKKNGVQGIVNLNPNFPKDFYSYDEIAEMYHQDKEVGNQTDLVKNIDKYFNYFQEKKSKEVSQPKEVVKVVEAPEIEITKEPVETAPVAEPKSEVDIIEEKVNNFNSKNREYKGKSKKELESELSDALEKESVSKKNISRAENTEEAIEEYNNSKSKTKEVEDKIKNLKNHREISSLIYDEIYESEKPNYEYRDLFNKDPRLAIIQSLKDLVDFLEERKADNDLESIGRYNENIKILEEDINNFPLKENTIVVKTKTEVSPIEAQESRVKSAESLLKEAKTAAAKKKAMKDLSTEQSRLAEMKAQEKVKTEAAPVEEEVDVYDTIGKEDTIAREKQQREINEAKADLEKIKNNDSNTIAKYVKKSGYKLITKKIIENTNNPLEKKALAGREGDYYKSTGVSVLVKTAKSLALNGAQRKANSKATGISTARQEQIIQSKRIADEIAAASKAKDLLDLDTKDKTNLQKVSDYLEKLDRSLDLDPNELNDVTRVMAIGTAKAVIKTLKALVNAGITLQEAIKRASEVHEVEPEKIIEALDIVSKINENKSEGLSEFELKGYNQMMTEVEGIVKKTKARLSRESVTDAVKKKRLLDAVMGYVTGSKVYEDASDVQRERLVRDVRKRFGFSERSAPSVGKLFGTLKDVNKITMTEKAALVKQIRDLGRGARDAVRAWRLASQQLSKDIKELRALGKITTNQAANVMRAFSKVNVFSQKSVDRFTTYMTKVFEKADYADKLKTAKETRSKIKKLAKNKDKNANLRDLASKFGKIEPSLVEDIDAYNELATQIKNATDGSKVRGQKVNFAETVNIANATDYVTKQIESQDKIFRDERIAELEELYGEDGIGFTDEEIKALLESDNPIPENNRDAIMATIKKAFDIYSTLIKDSISNEVDAFTGEDVSFTKAETDIINKFMSMDLNKIEEKNALQAVDALANFIENKSTAKMAATVATYTGDVNAEEVVKKGIYAVTLQKIWSPQFGSFLAEQTTTLPMVFEKMFKGFNRGGAVMDAMGLTKLINRKSFAERQANNIVADYVKAFYSTKANGEAFNTAYNNTERGMVAFMLRSVIGTEQEMKEEFDRRKGLVKQSIDALSEGTKEQKKQSELYQKVYDKIVVNSENLQDIKDKTDPKNLEAVDYWHKQWDSKFEQLSDVALGIYNKILNKDLNYSPDKYSKLKQKAEVDLINNDESAFIANTNGVLYNKKTGVLMDVTNSNKLPLNDKNKPISFVDLSFDKNNSNSMYDALVDIETAEPIRQVQAFLKSDNYSKIIPDADNAEMLAKRINTYVQNIRKKSPFTNDEFSKTIKKLNKIATLGVGQALGGVTQPIKQVIPVALNTLVNGQGLAVGASFNADFVKWLNESGYAIANRGVQSQADIESLNTLIEEASNSTGKKLLDKIEQANALMLKWFLEKPDVFIAKASWKTYYEKSLKQQGLYDGKIDYSEHELNEDAANYAQRMVDRQQNISDHDLAGNLFTDRSSKAQVLAKIFMPFASFRMNQASRLATDLSVLGHWSVSTKEDKKVALLSLASFATEMAVFKALSAGIGIALGYAANAWMDRDETDEEEDKRIANALKGQATSTVADLISPLPVFDKMLQTGAAMFLEGVKEGLDITDQDKLALYSAKPEGYLKSLGLYGMAPDKILELGKLISLAVTGTYTDDFGKEHTISKKDKETLTVMIGPAILTNIGFAPSEVSGVIRNSIKVAKKVRPTMTKTELKERFPEKYEEQYGENSRNYEIEQEQKERAKEQKERMKRN